MCGGILTMSLPVPIIDNIEFDELVTQSRSLIPRYAQSWTDHNTHDPGMMLIDLAAWIVEQQLYTAGFVSDEHFAAFAALLGVRTQSAQAALGEIWPDAGAIVTEITTTGVYLARGALAIARQQPAVVFRTSADLHITPAILINSTNTQLNQTRRHDFIIQEILFDRPLVEGPNPLSYPVAIGIELANVIQAVELDGAEGSIAVDYRLEESDQLNQIDPWQRVEIVSDTTRALNTNGVLLLQVPAVKLETQSTDKRRARLRIRMGHRINPSVPILQRLVINVIPVEQYQTIPAGLIASGSGLPDQQYPITTNGIDSLNPLQIEVAVAGNFIQWQRVDNFNEAKPDDRVYVLDEITDMLHFGNGVNGEVPLIDAQIRHLDYQVTDGLSGNLAANLDWNITGVQLNSGIKQFGSNIQPMRGGSDSWSADELRAAARQSATDRLALITNDDLELIGEELALLGIVKTDVLVGFDPSRPNITIPGTRTLLITPGNALHGTLENYLSAIRSVVLPRKVLGEKLNIAIKRQTVIDIAAGILVKDGSNVDYILIQVREILTARLSTIQRDDDIQPWEPGRKVTHNEIETLIAKVTGVESVTSCRFARAEDDLDIVTIAIDRDSVAVLGTLSLRHRFSQDRGD